MDWFGDRSAKERRAFIAKLVTVMGADGKFDGREIQFLASVSERIGFDPNELDTMLDRPEEVEMIAPRDPEERASQLVDCVFMMILDGDIDKRKALMCEHIAKSLGFNPDVVHSLVVAFGVAVDAGASVNDLKAMGISQLLS